MALDELERRVRREFDTFAYPEREWVIGRHSPIGQVHDVVIVGGGMAGIATAIGLRRERITNVLVVDRNPAGREGPWMTFARMLTLRTVKNLTGPDADIDSLTFRAWHEAQFGAEAYERIHLIDKGQWMDYLVWLRRTAQVPVENEVVVEDIAPAAGLLRLTVTRHGEPGTLLARRCVLANGYEGQGAPRIPDFADRLPRRYWAHTSDPIDFAALKAKRVGVLGAGASAFDNSAVALEAGASEVVQCVRRAVLPTVNWMRYAEFAGYFRGFPELDDARRIRFTRRIFELPTPPPQDTLARVLRHANYALRLGAAWNDARVEDERVRVDTARGVESFDFLIFGTGYEIDLALRPELQTVLPTLTMMRDRVHLGDDPASAGIGRQPFLGPGFECVPRPGAAPEVAHLYVLGPAALVSHGPICVGVNGMAFAIPRIVHALSRSFFAEDADRYHAQFMAFAEPELILAPDFGKPCSAGPADA